MKSTPLTFALLGVAGYIAPRHLEAIKETGNELVACFDVHDSVGILDQYFPQADFFTEFERFDRHLDKLRRSGNPVDFVVVCTPNYLHDAHIRFGLRQGASVICEKPVVLNPWNLEALREIEKETGKNVYTILQLRLHPSLLALKQKIEHASAKKHYEIELTYITARGNWYAYSWKGNEAKSGGVVTNIGIHFFDALGWLFGKVEKNTVLSANDKTVSGKLVFEHATVQWYLSIDVEQLPNAIQEKGERTFRSLTIEGQSFEFSGGFTKLHTQSYNQILKGQGFGLSDTAQAIQIVHDIRMQIPSKISY